MIEDSGHRPLSPLTPSRSWRTWLLGITIICYPPMVYFSLTRFGASSAGLLLSVLLLGKGLSSSAQRQRVLYFSAAIFLVGGTLISAELGASAALLYPVAVSAVLASVFGASLVWGPSIVWRMASLTHSAPKEARPYCDRVTVMWTGFFVLNAVLACWTVWNGDLALWTLYNGAISYLLMGILFAAEFVVRQLVRRKLSVRSKSAP